jgi:acyl-CoA synthetase (AMP-forming)/AMP-acid ligase II
VVGGADPRWGQAVHAHLRLKRGSTCPSDEQLRAWCHEALSPYKCPKAFYWRDALPRDPLGKLLRRHLTRLPQSDEGGPMSGEMP